MGAVTLGRMIKHVLWGEILEKLLLHTTSSVLTQDDSLLQMYE